MADYFATDVSAWLYIQEVLFQKEQGEEHQTQESAPTSTSTKRAMVAST